MEIIDLNIDNYKEERFSNGIALGNFDGIHIAHKEIILKTISQSEKLGLNPSVLLFNNHPKLITEGESPAVITPYKEKIRVLKELGIKTIYLIQFDKNLMELSPEDFVKKILIERLKTKLICVGFDYKFGYQASGNVDLLNKLGQKYEFKTVVIDPIYRDKIVSSTEIRSLIKKGNIEEANNMLGRKYSITGKVVDGNKIGHKLGFPTANLEFYDNYLIPKSGIYETAIVLDGKSYIGATSIGINPTFKNYGFKVETHILDFNKNIYGKELRLEFVRFIRDEKKFSNVEDLKKGIDKDINNIKSRY